MTILNSRVSFGQSLQVDNTLGAENSIIQPEAPYNGVPSNIIQGGAQRGQNLFHSFQDFHVAENKGIYFTNPSGVERIITRVTGRSRSEIMGKLGVDGGTANLFLINPNGIVFGPNSSLDLKGSFLASSASSITFSDTQYSALNPSPSTLLSINVPIGLQFRDTPGPIVNQSQVINFDTQEQIGLQVNPFKNLALIGGDVTFEGGFVTAPGGRIEIGSIAGIGDVVFNHESWEVGYQGLQTLGDIRLTQGSFITSEGSPGDPSGNIFLQGKNIFLNSGSLISALNLGSAPGGEINIQALDSVVLEGISADGLPSGFVAGAVSTGRGGDIVINADRLIVNEGLIQASSIATTFDSGDIVLATGQGGDIKITVSQLEMNGGSVISQTLGKTRGGNIVINATESVDILGSSQLSTEAVPFVLSGNGGEAGNITLNTKSLRIADNSFISSDGEGGGSAGNLEINASSILLTNEGILSSETTSGAGNIKLSSNNILLRENSGITTNATDTASSGNIEITTDTVVLEKSNITANSVNAFGGNVMINAAGIFIYPNSEVTASSLAGPQFDGTVNLNTTATEPDQGLVEVSTTVVDPSTIISQQPCDRGLNSAFFRSGRGGLPPAAHQDLSSEALQIGLVEAVPKEQKSTVNLKNLEISTLAKTELQHPTETQIIPAQGWVYNNNREITLVAHMPTLNSQQRPQQPSGCHAQ